MKITKELAEFIGILLGDGCVYLRGVNKWTRLKVTFNSNEISYIKFVKKLIEKTLGITPYFRKKKKENCSELLIFKRGPIIKLINLGLKLSPKRNNAVIPAPLLNSKLELDVLRGYFDTDGSVVLTNNNGILYPMQKQFPEILSKYGFRFGVYDCGNGEKRIQINGKEQLKKWIKLIGFHNERHIKKIKILEGIAGGGFSKPKA